MYFGRDVWDPILITAQIVYIQSSFYAVQCAWLLFLCYIGGHRLSLSLLFSAKSLSIEHTSVWMTVLAHVLSIPVCSFLISRCIERMHKCLDFCITLYGLHLLACILVDGRFPSNWEFWAVNIGAVVAVIELSAYLCAELESAEIVMPYHQAAKKGTPAKPPSSTAIEMSSKNSVEEMPLLSVQN